MALRRHLLAVRSHTWGACAVGGGTFHRDYAGLRSFSLRDRMGETLSRAVTSLTNTTYFQEDRLVTESRRKLVVTRSMPENLSQRLARQQRMHQHIIPSSVSVSADGTYITFMWSSALPDLGSLHPCHPLDAATEVKNGGESQKNRVESGGTVCSGPGVLPKSRLLAEFLRANTPSTDGSFATNIIIYGRRGITITDITPVGGYALRISFSDGHTGGIYPYEFLYFLSSPENKYRLMRDYIRALRKARKSRDPPRRMPSRRALHRSGADGTVSSAPTARHSGSGEGSHIAPACQHSPRQGTS